MNTNEFWVYTIMILAWVFFGIPLIFYVWYVQDPFDQFRKLDDKMVNNFVNDLKEFQLSQTAPGERELASQLRKSIVVLEQAFSETSNSFFKEKADELKDIADQLELHADTGNCAYSYSEMKEKIAIIQAQIDALPTKS